MSENEQDLRDEQDRRGYADIRPKEKQYREPPIKPSTTTITHEPTPRHPVRLPPQQQPIDIEIPSIDNISKKKSQEKQHHQSYPQPQPNLSTGSTSYNNNNGSTSVLKPSTSYGPVHAPPSSLAPPVQPSSSALSSYVPYPPQKQSYSTLDDISVILDRLSIMEDKIAYLDTEVKDLRRENMMLRSDLEYPMVRRRESMGRFPQDRHHYNKSADHHTRYVDYVEDYTPPPLPHRKKYDTPYRRYETNTSTWSFSLIW
ncbi:hypothetical protein K501DRAFT_330671 [Backusella circina FSU 941]|nr:hypothetical protein K501DRAFT_330671 [Backusella circina FSU 941]